MIHVSGLLSGHGDTDMGDKAVSIRLSISRSVLPPLVNITLKYLNSSTWDSTSSPTQSNLILAAIKSSLSHIFKYIPCAIWV